MNPREYPGLSSEKRIAAAIRLAEIREEDDIQPHLEGSVKLSARLLKTVARLETIVPSLAEHGTLTAALESDKDLRYRMKAYEGGRQFVIRIKKALREEDFLTPNERAEDSPYPRAL